MKKKISILLLMVILIIGITGCVKKNEKALEFKEEYESLNGKTNAKGVEYRTITIDENNPYVKTTIEDIENKILNNESFYLYVGDSLCPWCRSGLEKMIEVAKKEKIETIYYIDFWDDDHNEILRDLYEIVESKGKITFNKTKDAVPGYETLLNEVYNFVQNYTITQDGKEYNVGVKRVYGGDHFYFENGKCKKYVSLRSDLLSKANDELTEEVLKDQENKFTQFFSSSNACYGYENC